MTILEILDLVASNTKRKFKEGILNQHASNDLLRKVFWAAYNPDLVYWISKHPKVDGHAGTLTLDTAIDEVLACLATRKLTGAAGVRFYQDTLAALTKQDAIVLQRIIDGDLRCGVAISTINKIWTGCVPTYPIMLADDDPSRLQFPDVVVQTKYDGVRCLISRTDDGDILMRTRNGKPIQSLEVMYPDLKMVIGCGEEYDGELVCYDKNEIPLPRKVSNGIITKALRGTITAKEADMVRFLGWDVVDRTQAVPYDIRLQKVIKDIFEARQKGVRKVISAQTVKVECLKDVERLFEEALQRGEEGVIAKNLKSFWESRRSSNLCKFKAKETADLVVVDWEPGEGKNEGILGALVCETEDGGLRVNVGTGFSDTQRRSITPENSAGKIIEVKYNSIIDKKGGGVKSLYLARFLKFRPDKDTANTTEEIK